MANSRSRPPKVDPVQAMLARAELNSHIERARIAYETRSKPEIEAAAQAYERLLVLIETRSSGQIERLAPIMAAFFDWTRFKMPVDSLGGFDFDIDEDIQTVLRGFRWEKLIYEHVRNGERRTDDALVKWGLLEPRQPRPPEAF